MRGNDFLKLFAGQLLHVGCTLKETLPLVVTRTAVPIAINPSFVGSLFVFSH